MPYARILTSVSVKTRNVPRTVGCSAGSWSTWSSACPRKNRSADYMREWALRFWKISQTVTFVSKRLKCCETRTDEVPRIWYCPILDSRRRSSTVKYDSTNELRFEWQPCSSLSKAWTPTSTILQGISFKRAFPQKHIFPKKNQLQKTRQYSYCVPLCPRWISRITLAARYFAIGRTLRGCLEAYSIIGPPWCEWCEHWCMLTRIHGVISITWELCIDLPLVFRFETFYSELQTARHLLAAPSRNANRAWDF